ncbi:MAG: hypothetical protein KBT34_09940 [Prevotella sp.]|nr:hypothetical protein [Candidatus Prevotella equi]
MTDAQRERIKKLGLKESDFEKDAEQTTIEDLVEALDILTSIVLGGDE